MNTAEFLTISSAIVPDRVALVDDRSSVTYMELQSRVNRLAQAMQGLGIGKGKNVGVMAVNSATFVEIYYASAALGATLVPLNYRAKPEELTYMVGAADVNLLFVAERYLPVYDAIKDTLSSVEHVYCVDTAGGGYQSIDQLREGGEDIPVFADVDDQDSTLIIYTSGTTSQPKGVVLTYQALTALVVNTQAPADPTLDQQSILVSVPFYHIAGATTMMSAIFSGRKLAILPQFEAEAWLTTVQNEAVNVAFVVPTMLKRLMEVENLDDYDLSALRLITYGAAPMPYQVVRQAVDVFPPNGIDLMNAFGQTEATGTISILGPDDHRFDGTPEENEQKDLRLRSVGKATGDMEIGILAADGRQLPTDDEGEICIRRRHRQARRRRVPLHHRSSEGHGDSRRREHRARGDRAGARGPPRRRRGGRDRRAGRRVGRGGQGSHGRRHARGPRRGGVDDLREVAARLLQGPGILRVDR
jgi:acyl-CoA synthetase (AMP-forming)/AMP-acid ligase II